MNRRDFMGWLSGAAATFLVPMSLRGALRKSDEQPFDAFSDFTAEWCADGRVSVFVAITGNIQFSRLREVAFRAIDRPLFAMKPQSWVLERLSLDCDGSCTGRLRFDGEEGEVGAIRWADEHGNILGPFRTYHPDKCDDLTFTPAVKPDLRVPITQ